MASQPSCRMYIDECGSASMRNVSASNRYLSLTGVIVDSDYHRSTITPDLTAFKQRYWSLDDDDPVILHRCDMHSCTGQFAFLRDPGQRSVFNSDLLSLLSRWDYTVITATIDKQAHLSKYHSWAYEPYSYCVEVLTEKYVLWLHQRNRTGDVLAEARGGNEDMALKKAYSDWYVAGTRYADAGLCHERLSSRELKLKRKDANISGLQIADLVAQPSFRYGLALHNGTTASSTYERDVITLLCNSKYNRKRDGTIDGYDTKWLP
ncbi:MAG: hypothetical protein C0398_02155 [Coprothermobacter sp.]|nr:hypothetical protein [Coprothermobacter sp.]